MGIEGLEENCKSTATLVRLGGCLAGAEAASAFHLDALLGRLQQKLEASHFLHWVVNVFSSGMWLLSSRAGGY